MFLKRNNFKVLFLIFMAGAILRFYNFGAIPAGLTNDEAGVGYDAFSVLKTTRDQWGNILPLFSFKGFGDYRPVLYTYLTTLPVWLFGLNVFAVRLISLLSGILLLPLVYFLAKKIFDQKTAVVASIFTALSGWLISMSRVGIESNLLIFLVSAVVYLLYLSRENLRYLMPAFILSVFCFFTYYAGVFLVPVLWGVFYLLYNAELKRGGKNIKRYFAVFFLLFLLLAGFILVSNRRFGQINNINDIGLVNEINERRGACGEKFSSLVCKITENRGGEMVKRFLANYLNHYSYEFLVKSGSNTALSTMPPTGFLYIIEYIFLAAGIICLVFLKSKNNFFVLVWFLVAAIPDSLTSSGHYSRMLVMLPVVQIIAAYGAMRMFDRLGKKPKLANLMFPIAVAVLFYEALTFYVRYQSYFPKYFSRQSHYGYEELMKYVGSIKNKYQKIYISNKYNDTKQYIFYLFFNRLDPYEYQLKTSKEFHQEDNFWISVDRIENIYFIPSLSNVRVIENNSLILASPLEISDALKRQKEIKDLKGDVLFAGVLGDDYLRLNSIKQVK